MSRRTQVVLFASAPDGAAIPRAIRGAGTVSEDGQLSSTLRIEADHEAPDAVFIQALPSAAPLNIFVHVDYGETSGTISLPGFAAAKAETASAPNRSTSAKAGAVILGILVVCGAVLLQRKLE